MEENPMFSKTRMKRYMLTDNYFQFWFRYVYPNRWLIEAGKAERVMEIIEEVFNKYVSHVFERVIRDYMGRKMNYDMVGNWWNWQGEEIGLVAIRGKEITLGEIKWRNRKLDCTVLENLKKKIRDCSIEEKKFKRVRYLLVSNRDSPIAVKKRNLKTYIELWERTGVVRHIIMAPVLPHSKKCLIPKGFATIVDFSIATGRNDLIPAIAYHMDTETPHLHTLLFSNSASQLYINER